ncbi:hypothetical protein J0H58_38485 [bacterium]|nr:hypothetical protein [bacterium]
MPTIYQARCGRCTYASDVFPAEYGAVLVDVPPVGGSGPAMAGAVVAGAVLHGAAGEARIAEQSDPRLVVLAHPAEEHILAETGFTWTGLAIAGRYVRVRQVVCRDCGTLFEVRRLTCPPALGCQIGCVSGLVAGVAAGVWWRSFWLGFGTAYGTVLGCMAVVGAAGWAYTRVRFRRRAREVGGLRSCPRCGSGRYAGVESRLVFPCPQCSQRSLKVRSVGKS